MTELATGSIVVYDNARPEQRVTFSREAAVRGMLDEFC